MDLSEKTLRALTLCNHYNQWIYDKIVPYVGDTILEVGCGIGNMSRFFMKSGTLVSLEPEKKYTKYMHIDFPDLKIYNFDITNEDDVLKLEKYDFDTVICINVLEHIENDLKAIENMYRLLKPGGKMILFVPAHPFLYGALDKEVKHCRRYSRQELLEKVSRFNVDIKKIRYFNRIGVVGWFLNGRIRKNRHISLVQLFVYDRLVPLIRKVDPIFNLPWGLDLFIVAEKK